MQTSKSTQDLKIKLVILRDEKTTGGMAKHSMFICVKVTITKISSKNQNNN